MDRVHNIRRKTFIAGAALATALFLGIVPATYAQTSASPANPPATAAPAPATTATPAPGGAPATTPAPAGAESVAPPTGDNSTTKENPYDLKSLWANGDFVARGAIIILALMSLGTWFILITKFLDQQGLFAAARAANRNFFNASSAEDGAARLSRSSPYRALAEDGLEAVGQHTGGLASQVSLNDHVAAALNRSVSSINQRVQGGLPFLATVGSTAPFVGLFGTVWGIYHALIAIGLAGQASIDKVAGPVGEALIMTAIGLGVAVPAVFFYNLLVARNKVGMEQVREFAGKLQTSLVGGR